jgi:hypothetical protein
VTESIVPESNEPDYVVTHDVSEEGQRYLADHPDAPPVGKSDLNLTPRWGIGKDAAERLEIEARRALERGAERAVPDEAE